MTWVKLDNGFREHRKVLRATPAGVCLWVCGLDYCNRQAAHDGFIPAEVVPVLYPMPQPMKVARKLVEVGLWETVEGGFQVHDYHVYQPTAEAKAALREKRAEAGRRGGLRSGESRRQTKAEAPPKQIASGLPPTNEANANPVPVPVFPGTESVTSESETVARAEEDQDVGRSDSPPGWDRDLTPDLEAELQQRFVDAFLADPSTEWGAFTTWYRNHPPGLDANWSVLADAWLRGITDKGEASDRPRRRGPRAVHELLNGVGRPLDDPEAVRKAELAQQGRRLRAMEGG